MNVSEARTEAAMQSQAAAVELPSRCSSSRPIDTTTSMASSRKSGRGTRAAPEDLSLLLPHGEYDGSCGYCDPEEHPGEKHASFGSNVEHLSCADYQGALSAPVTTSMHRLIRRECLNEQP